MRSFNIVGTILERDWTDSDVCYQSSQSSTRANVTPNYGGTYEYALDDRPASSPNHAPQPASDHRAEDASNPPSAPCKEYEHLYYCWYRRRDLSREEEAS